MLRSQILRLVASHPDMRGALLPLLKEAFDFPNQKALDKYLKEHPKADRHKHTVERVKKQRGGRPDEHGSFYDKKHKVHLRGITQEDFNAFLDDPEGKEIQERYRLDIIAGGDGIIDRKDLERAREVRKKLKASQANSTDDVCKVNPKVCTKNLGIRRDSMPQFTAKPIKSSLKAMPDARFKAILADIEKSGRGAALDKLTDAERDKFATRKDAEAAVKAGADPKSAKSTFDQFLDTLRKEGVKITDLTRKGMKARNLHATQAEIRAGTTLRNADKYLRGKIKYNPTDVIYVSKDNHILDGHHRWSGILVADPDGRIPVVKIDIPMKELLQRSFDQPGVFRQDFRFEVVDEDKPIDLVRENGETWKQRNGKFYGKNQEGKVGGPYTSEEKAQEFAKGKTASVARLYPGQGDTPTSGSSMSTLRAQVIQLAQAKPELRSTLLPFLKQAMDFDTQEALDKYLKDHPGADKALHHVKKNEGGGSAKSPEKQEAAPKGRFKLTDPGGASFTSSGAELFAEQYGKGHAMRKTLHDLKPGQSHKTEDGWTVTHLKGASMYDLRKSLIRLAHTNVNLRPQILEILKEAGEVPEAFKKNWDKGDGKDDKDEDDKDSGKPWEKDKKAGEVPEAFKKNWDKGDGKSDDKADDKDSGKPWEKDKKASRRRAGEVPEAFKKNWDKGEGKDDKDEDDKSEKPWEKDKKASHKTAGFAVVRRMMSIAVRVLQSRDMGNGNKAISGTISFDLSGGGADALRFKALVGPTADGWAVHTFEPFRPITGGGTEGVLAFYRTALLEALVQKGDGLLHAEGVLAV